MAEFEILAAIDLRAGRVVRLREGDFERETTYGDDPVAMAVELVGRGSRWLHVVDLDGARTGRPAHGAVIAEIVETVGALAHVEVGGGIRDAATAAGWLAVGSARVVIGTAALATALAGELVKEYGADRVAVALDVRAGQAVGSGWRGGGEATELGEAVSTLLMQGVQTFEVTAIERDGTLDGPDLDLLRRVRAAAPNAGVIASGGVRSIEDLEAVRRLGCSGAIVGRAIYEGGVDVRAALSDWRLQGG